MHKCHIQDTKYKYSCFKNPSQCFMEQEYGQARLLVDLNDNPASNRIEIILKKNDCYMPRMRNLES